MGVLFQSTGPHCMSPFSCSHGCSLYLIKIHNSFSLCIGENTIVIVGEACSSFQPKEVGGARDLVARAKVVVCQLEILPQTTLAALKMAKELGGELYAKEKSGGGGYWECTPGQSPQPVP